MNTKSPLPLGLNPDRQGGELSPHLSLRTVERTPITSDP